MQTKHMRADEIANGFNSVADRQYWKASLAGSRLHPEVHFNSRSTMVRVVYRITPGDFTLTFSRTDAAFGDFLASGYKALVQVLQGLKAAGLPFASPLDVGDLLRIEYGPVNRDVTVHLANLGEPWTEAESLPFKEPVRENEENTNLGVDPE